MPRPIDIDTSDWRPFDENSPTDAMCERERIAFTQYTLKRLKKIPKTGNDETSIWVGGMMAIVQMAYAMHGNDPPDTVRDALHQTLDFAWLQCAGMTLERKDMN